MNVEHSLLSKIISTGAIEEAIARGIEEEHFEDEDTKAIYAFMLEHVRKYKVQPSFEAIRAEIESIEKREKRKLQFQITAVEDALGYLIDQFIGLIKYRATVESVRELAAMTSDSTQWLELDVRALEIARNLSMIVPSSQVARLSDVEKRIEEYERRKREGNMWGTKIGIPTLDNLTLGLQPSDLATIAGWMGLGKSTLAQVVLFNAYLQDKTPMMISGEMDADALFRKWDTMAANYEAKLKVDYNALKALDLGPKQMDQLKKWGEKAAAAKADRDIIVIDDIGKMTVDKVFSETIRYSPDLVCVDYIGLMDAPNHIGQGWEKITYCTKALKQNARNLKIPHIVVAQTNREDGGTGPELGKLAGSLSIGRDSDQVYGLFQDDIMKEDERMEIRLLKNRDGAQGTAVMKWQPGTMEFRELGAAENYTRVG
jgi:replicative DNA helicase